VNAMVKRPARSTLPDFDGYVLAMFLLWASRPREVNPDETGAYFIGDVGEAPEQPTFERWCPYSLAQPRTSGRGKPR